MPPSPRLKMMVSGAVVEGHELRVQHGRSRAGALHHRPLVTAEAEPAPVEGAQHCPHGSYRPEATGAGVQSGPSLPGSVALGKSLTISGPQLPRR